LVGYFSKILSLITPQKRLPKIQDVADLLKTEIEERYADYDEIYLVTHSMGGLVARKYLYDMLQNSQTLQVTKLMLYAVPNNGSDWAKFSTLYKHEQIAQLDRESDFLQHLNREVDHVKLEEHISVRYVVGKYDDVVNESSARGYWGNLNISSLPKGHLDIVKPENCDDLSFLVLKNFLTSTSPSPIPSPPYREDVLNNPFVEEVTQRLKKKKLVTLFSQDSTTINEQQALVKQKLQFVYAKNFYHLRIPQNVHDELAYFSFLAKDCDFSKCVERTHEWLQSLSTKLEKREEKLCFYITGIENGDKALNREFAEIIRALQDEYSNFYVLFVGKKRLASLVYGKDSDLSPLNTAEKIFFDNALEHIGEEDIRQIFENLKAKGENPCAFLDDEVKVNWVYYSDSILNTLFWRGIMLKQNGMYVWRYEATKRVAKEVFAC
jgi:predicted alpha/beta hydrolase family esterase